MNFDNGTTLLINTVPVKVLGKTESGAVIVQTSSGLDFTWPVDFLGKLVDKE